MILQLTTAWIEDRNFTRSIQDNCVTLLVGYITHASQFDRAATLTTLFVFFRCRCRNTTDVESTHRQLSARFTDTLGSDDADRHAFFDLGTSRHVHAVALATNSQRSFTSHRATNLNLFQTHFFDLASDFRSDHLIFPNHYFVSHRVYDVLASNPAFDRCCQSNFNLFTTIDDTFGDTLNCTAIVECDHNVLGNVSQLTSQVT